MTWASPRDNSCNPPPASHWISARIGGSDSGSHPAHRSPMSHAPKRSVYILRSVKDPTRSYIGLTADIATRVADHNAGACPQTARHGPWRVVVLLQFADEHRAAHFEKYLKSATGRAFAQAHFA